MFTKALDLSWPQSCTCAPGMRTSRHRGGLSFPSASKIASLDIFHSAEFESYLDDAPLNVQWHRDPFNAENELTEDEAELKVQKQ